MDSKESKEGLKDALEALVAKYRERLEENGIEIVLKRKYFEEDVRERPPGHGISAIFNSIDRARDARREREKGYFYIKNRYHTLILQVLPLKKGLVRREDCREYAFLIKRVDRPHVGEDPRRVIYNRERILARIERRIERILKRAERHDARRACKNTLFDALRYSHATKYHYKESFCGKDRFAWDMIWIAAYVAVLVVLFVGIPFLIGKLR